MKLIGEATNNTSQVVAALADADTTDDMKRALETIKGDGNEELARSLSKALIAATNSS